MHTGGMKPILLCALGLGPFAVAASAPAEAVVTLAAPPQAAPFSLHDVRLLEGPFKTGQDIAVKYLLSLEPDRFLSNFRKEAGRCGQAISAAGKTARRDFAVIALRRENRAEYDLTPHGVMHFLDDLLGSKCNWKVLVDNFATHGRQQGDKSKMTGEQWGEIRERLQPLIEVLDGQIDGYRLLAAIQPRKKRSDYARAFKAKHQKQAE